MIAVCIVLLVLGFLAPKLSRRLQARVDRGADRGRRVTDDKAQDAQPVDKMAKSSIDTTQKAADRTSEAGREGRSKIDP
ncbi:MAG: hypothetical protein WAM30_21700 [Candidatus Dormiibacterota bacterium]